MIDVLYFCKKKKDQFYYSVCKIKLQMFFMLGFLGYVEFWLFFSFNVLSNILNMKCFIGIFKY